MPPDKMKRLARKLPLIFFVAALLLLIAWLMTPPPLGVDVADVKRGSLQVTVEEDGVTRIRERYLVSSPLAGRLLRIELHPGDRVEEEKTVLAVIEPTDPQLLDARARAEAEARVKSAEATLKRTQAGVTRANVDYEFADTDRNRARRLIRGGNISEEEYDRAAQKERVAAEELKSARFAVQVAQYELELARAALPLTRRRSTDRSFEIRSPIGGRVLRVVQESATVVSPSQPLMELGNPTDLEIVVDVLSSDGVKISQGARTFLEHWGGEEVLEGQVRLVEPAAFTKVSALGVEEQRVNVLIDFVDPPEERPGLGDAFRVDARIVIWEGEDVVKCPVGVLFRDGERWAVFKFEAGKAVLRHIRVGQRNALEAEVLEGLSEGDRVILHPSDEIQDGLSVAERR